MWSCNTDVHQFIDCPPENLNGSGLTDHLRPKTTGTSEVPRLQSSTPPADYSSGLDMQEIPIHQTRMHRGFLFVNAAWGIIVLCGVSGLIWLATFPVRMLAGAMYTKIPSFAYLPIAPILILLVLIWVSAFISYFKSEITFTSNSVRFKTGLVFRTEAHLRWSEIETVLTRQGPLGSFLGYGTLILIGSAGTPFLLAYMPDYQKLRELALNLIDNAKGSHLVASSQSIETSLVTSDKLCASCGASATSEDVDTCERSPRRFNNQILCSKCRTYLPPE